MVSEYGMVIFFTNDSTLECMIVQHSLENGILSFIRNNRERYLVPLSSIKYIQFESKLDEILTVVSKKDN